MTSIKAALSAKQRWIYLFFGTTVTVILLSWALRDVSLIAVWNTLKVARPEWLFLGWIAYLASYWVRAWRWGTLLTATCDPGRFKTRLSAIFIGFGVSSVLPAYLGEFARATVLSRLDQVPLNAAIGSLFAERLLDVGIVFLFLLLPIWFGQLPHHSNFSQLPIGWIGSVIVMIWIAFLIGASYPNQITNLAEHISKIIGLGRFRTQITSAISGFLSGLTALKQPRRSFTALLETVLVWGLNGITYWSGLIAFGILAPGFPGALLTQSTTALAIAIPYTPGYVGPFEAGIRFSLSVYDIPVPVVIAYAVALRFIMYVTIPIIAGIVVGILSLSTPNLGALIIKSSGNKH